MKHTKVMCKTEGAVLQKLLANPTLNADCWGVLFGICLRQAVKYQADLKFTVIRFTGQLDIT